MRRAETSRASEPPSPLPSAAAAAAAASRSPVPGSSGSREAATSSPTAPPRPTRPPLSEGTRQTARRRPRPLGDDVSTSTIHGAPVP
eukprot:CAMPEP_0172629136 /NCGR_PEP_ID=MMETSP1068-20121228/165887_1 /TAXON_ID=35684 /ORGANISM="Pseudopedinella elastica, Strain CCMP716" /LENGTH=86 /DNA_ID=CAMNT_0013439579 /DNA_START=31 /DNA_END=288 /DNA_ORIENTATION=-